MLGGHPSFEVSVLGVVGDTLALRYRMHVLVHGEQIQTQQPQRGPCRTATFHCGHAARGCLCQGTRARVPRKSKMNVAADESRMHFYHLLRIAMMKEMPPQKMFVRICLQSPHSKKHNPTQPIILDISTDQSNSKDAGCHQWHMRVVESLATPCRAYSGKWKKKQARIGCLQAQLNGARRGNIPKKATPQPITPPGLSEIQAPATVCTGA